MRKLLILIPLIALSGCSTFDVTDNKVAEIIGRAIDEACYSTPAERAVTREKFDQISEKHSKSRGKLRVEDCQNLDDDE